jgi:hypothetical protein
MSFPSQRRAQVLQLLVVLVQQDDVISGHLLLIGDHHELQLESQRHTDPRGGKIQHGNPLSGATGS